MFLGQKSKGLDFLATIVVEIWVKQVTRCLPWQATRRLLLAWLLGPRCLGLVWLP